MEIALTWNLVLLIVLIGAFAYNFLLGQNSTLKLIIAIYIAILTADGIARALKDYVFDASSAFTTLLGDGETKFFIGLRIGLFLLAIIILVTKGGFKIHLSKHDHWAVRTMVHAVFSAMSAILFLGTILIYFSGNSFADGIVQAQQIEIYRESLIAQILIDYYQIWFSLPAVGFLATSFIFPSEGHHHHEEDDEE